MDLIDVIMSKNNLNEAYLKVVANKGAAGIEDITVDKLGQYIKANRNKIVTSIMTKQYHPLPVKRVYIPKDNGDKRPLGIPITLDRVIQQVIAKPVSDRYEKVFSEEEIFKVANSRLGLYK